MNAVAIYRHGNFPLVGIILCIVLSGCVQSAFLRGKVEDISGEELPGVVVRVSGRDSEGLSNANGRYAFRSVSGALEVVFLKTGYTSVHKEVNVPSLGILDVDDVQLWPLPAGEGVFAFQNNQYTQTDHPRVNRYRIEDGGIAYGTPVDPTLIFDYVDSETVPGVNQPHLYSHKLPAYDARLHKLRQVKGTLAQSATDEKKNKSKKDGAYNEEVWIPEESIPLLSHPVDEPEHLLLELRPVRSLATGIYAIHWGSLEGYEGIDHRAFLFALQENTPEEDPAPEGEPEDQGQDNAQENDSKKKK